MEGYSSQTLAVILINAFCWAMFVGCSDDLVIGPGANLVNVDLSGRDLSGLDLSGSNLSGADLSGSNLSDTDLSDANLTGANLSGAIIDRSLLENLESLTAEQLNTVASSNGIRFNSIIRICEALRPVILAGRGVEESTPYNPSDNLKPVVMMKPSGVAHFLNSHLPKEWLPTSVQETQLVLCIGKQHTKIVETCDYRGGWGKISKRLVIRYRYYVELQLFEAYTGMLISNSEVLGSYPPACPYIYAGHTNLYGTRIPNNNLLSGIRTFLNAYVR